MNGKRSLLVTTGKQLAYYFISYLTTMKLYYAELLEGFTYTSYLEINNLVTGKTEIIPNSGKEMTIDK